VEVDAVMAPGSAIVGSSGILGMRERALLAGGHFTIERVRGTGVTVRVRRPDTSSLGTERRR
jgi:signal transduction histidine kinase